MRSIWTIGRSRTMSWSSEMYLPLCDICKHQNDKVMLVWDATITDWRNITCSDGKMGCPGFEPKRGDA